MFWVHLYQWLALNLLVLGIIGLRFMIIKDDHSFLFSFLFILGFTGFIICLASASHYMPVTHCMTKPGDTIVWGGHHEGKAADWWVFIPTTDSNKFCEVHNRELYNMGNGYKLAQTYIGVLVYRP